MKPIRWAICQRSARRRSPRAARPHCRARAPRRWIRLSTSEERRAATTNPDAVAEAGGRRLACTGIYTYDHLPDLPDRHRADLIADLGTTLIHEHLRTRDEAVLQQWPGIPSRRNPEREIEPGGDYDAAVEAASAAVELGVRTIGEPTAMFLGRDVDFMRRVSEDTEPGARLHRHLHRPPPDLLRQPHARSVRRTCSYATSRSRSRRRRSGRRSSSAPPTSPG